MKAFEVYRSGSTQLDTIIAKDIYGACEIFRREYSIDREMKTTVTNSDYASIGYSYKMCSEYVVMSA